MEENVTSGIKFSFIMPVYNAARHLRSCLDSLINQSVPEIEIICVNDGSTDESLSILLEYKEQDPRIKVFSQKNAGPAKARNKGLSEAKGEYLWFVDADDSVVENACKTLSKIIEKNHPDVICFGSTVFDVRNRKYVFDAQRYLYNVPDKHIGKVIRINRFPDAFTKVPTEAWNKVFKRDFLQKENLHFDVELWGMDDGFFTQESLLKASSIFITRDRLYGYKIFNPGSIVSYLLKVSFKNYSITINYSKATLRLIKKLSLKQEVINSLIARNVSRMLYYWGRCRGILKVLYQIKFKAHMKDIVKKYPFILDNESVGNGIRNILRSKIITAKAIKFFLFHKTKKTKTLDFYRIDKKKYYILGLPLYRKRKKAIDVNLFQTSLITKFQRSINAALTNRDTFAEFKNCNTGRDVVLMGAGPSVKCFSKIDDAVYIGCNRAVLLKSVSFDYIFAIDKIGLEATGKALLNYPNERCVKFIGDINCGIDYQIPEDFRIKCGARPYKTTGGIVSARFTMDIDKEPLGSFHSVALQAIQFALFTNPRRIYLVGMDCSSNGKHFAGKEHFVSKRGENILELQKAQINEWKLLKKFANLYYPDIQILSVNPVGLKGIFQEVYTKKFLKKNPDINVSTVTILEDK